MNLEESSSLYTSNLFLVNLCQKPISTALEKGTYCIRSFDAAIALKVSYHPNNIFISSRKQAARKRRLKMCMTIILLSKIFLLLKSGG